MDLDREILTAHEHGAKATLIGLYQRAAKDAETSDAKAFFLTYAHVFALELGHPDQPKLFAALKALGRE